MNTHPRILVVDDDPDFLDFAKAVLDGDKYAIAVASGDEEALAELEREKPDLLILDVMMSRLDSGFQLMWKLKADDSYKAIPILMVTSVDKELNMDFASHAMGANRTADDESYLPVASYLTKPVKPAQLLASVERALTDK